MANLKEQIELASINAPPGILPTGTKFDSYIGQNVINLSKVILTEHQVTALEKGLTFCPTPGAPDKSQIWDDFKEFHRSKSKSKLGFYVPFNSQGHIGTGPQNCH